MKGRKTVVKDVSSWKRTDRGFVQDLGAAWPATRAHVDQPGSRCGIILFVQKLPDEIGRPEFNLKAWIIGKQRWECVHECQGSRVCLRGGKDSKRLIATANSPLLQPSRQVLFFFFLGI